MNNLVSIHVVYANWCPHCVPTTVEPVKEKAKELDVACILYDIDDPDVSKKADDLVKEHGDWSVDYLIPQVFLEYDNGEIRHILTGYSEDVEFTRRGIHILLTSRLLTRRA